MAEKKNPVSLSTMTGAGDPFIVNGKDYAIRPLKLKEVDEFTNDGLSVGTQLFNFYDQEMKEKLEKWIERTFSDDGGKKTLKDLIDEDWTIVDLKNALRKLADLSG